MGNIGRQVENLRKKFKEILEIKITAAEMEDTFNRLISRLNTARERMNELKARSI